MRALAILPVVLASAASASPRELTPAELGWPAATRSLEAKAATAVRRTGARDRIGVLAPKTRVAWKRLVAAGDGCRAHVEIEPRGWVCAKAMTPSERAPAPAIDPEAVVERTLAQNFMGVAATAAPAYDSPAQIQRHRPARKLDAWRFVRQAISDVAVVGGIVYLKTIEGYVASKDLAPRPASRFAGTPVSDASWPLAWTVTRPHYAPIVVRAAPSVTAAQIREVPRRTRVAILERRDGFARVGEGAWIALADLNIAAVAKRPKGVGAAERWIDVDLDEQTLVAYEGDTPVYATLISTGLGRSTPTSLHRIRSKKVLIDLTAPAVSYGSWDNPETPFYMDFRLYYAIHGAYWHDQFGTKRSHGCVNASPRDAAWLFQWTLPEVPPGWLESTDRRGTPVRIRDRAHPDPPWTDYNAPPPVPIRTGR